MQVFKEYLQGYIFFWKLKICFTDLLCHNLLSTFYTLTENILYIYTIYHNH